VNSDGTPDPEWSAEGGEARHGAEEGRTYEVRGEPSDQQGKGPPVRSAAVVMGDETEAAAPFPWAG